AARSIRPGADPLTEFKEHAHDFTDVLPVAGVVGLDHELPAGDERAVHQCKERWRDEPPLNLGWVVIRLRMIAVDFRDAGRLDPTLEQFVRAPDGKAEIGQPALIAAF